MNNLPRAIGYVLLFSYLAGLLALTIGEWHNPNIRDLVLQHFRAIVLIPAAGLFAFLVVAIFESTAGKINFSALGLTFEDAAGPIIMWVICFLSITVSIRVLW